MQDLIDKTIKDNKEELDRLARHDSGDDIIDTSNIKRAMEKQEKLTKIESIIREVCRELVIEHYQGEQEPAIELLPIHLEHILRAIYELGDTIYMSTTGEVIDACTCVCNYDLTLPLQSQSDEFISWLYRVLCSN